MASTTGLPGWRTGYEGSERFPRLALAYAATSRFATAHHHPELVDQTIWDVFETERAQLVPYADRFDGFMPIHCSAAIISTREPMTLVSRCWR